MRQADYGENRQKAEREFSFFFGAKPAGVMYAAIQGMLALPFNILLPADFPLCFAEKSCHARNFIKASSGGRP
ncbi:MAG: hypothetical protein LBO03_06685 [Acidaminococcales bacterium]|nr:hypothetical protein [Acidaminococcales bacterium]